MAFDLLFYIYMKNAILTALILSLPGYTVADEWRSADTTREAIFVTEIFVDWMTTINEPWPEQNPILGRHPTNLEVSGYMASVLLLHAGISYILPQGWRDIWQYVTIGVEGVGVANNLRIFGQVKLLW